MELFTLSLYLIIFYIAYKLLNYLYRLPWIRPVSIRRVFITGCDTGFGHEIAKRLDKYGVHVFAGCLTEKGETELKKVCSKRFKTVHIDVSDPESVRRAYEEVKRQIPGDLGLWGLINNAGITGCIGPVEWMQIKDYQQVLDVNLLGLINTTVTFLPLIKQAKGRVVNTASVFGRTSLVGIVPYCLSKYGVEAFSDALRRQMRDYGVTVHLIEPGFHKTNMTNTQAIEATMRKAWANCSPEVREEYGEEYLEQVVKNIVHQFVSGIVSERISDVVDAYENAVLAIFPHARYLVGKDAKYFWVPVSWLPEWMGDWLLEKLAMDKPVPNALKKNK